MRNGIISLMGLMVGSLLCPQGADAAVGRTQGTFDVSPTGAATYQIPIWVPPGTKGVQPNLAILYNSQNEDNGTMGPGWSLAGLGAISRCVANVAQDGVAAAVTLTADDKFCLNGNKLRLTNGTYGSAGSTYQTELADFSEVTAMGSAGNGPAYFTVTAKSGLKYEYGSTVDSRIESLNPDATSTPRDWALNKVSDRSGNTMTITYQEDGSPNGGYRPSHIDYTANSNTGLAAAYRVDFVWEARPDPVTGYVAGGVVRDGYRLNRIQTQYKDPSAGTWQLVRKHQLSYDISSVTQHSRLTAVQECERNGDCLAPTNVSWQSGQAGFGLEQTAANVGSLSSSAIRMDINGDGRSDVLYPCGNNWCFMLATTTGSYTSPFDTAIAHNNKYASALPLDYNLDSKADLLVPDSGGNWQVLQSTGIGFAVISTGYPATGAANKAWIADINGDGWGDLLYASDASNLSVRYGSALGFSTTATIVFTASNPYPLLDNSPFNPKSFSSSIGVADFNGDGKVDLTLTVSYLENSEFDPLNGGLIFYYQSERVFLVSGANGTYTVASTEYFGPSNNGNRDFEKASLKTLDINGDGISDIAYPCGPVVWCVKFGTHAGLSATINSGIPWDYTGTNVIAVDWDGDGKHDLLTAGSTGNWKLIRSTGDPTTPFSAPVDTGIPVGNLAANGDINGDAQLDLMYADSAYNWRYRLHNGDYPDLVTGITDGLSNNVSMNYAPLTDNAVYTKGSGATLPEIDVQNSMYVVSQVVASDGIGGVYAQNYSYSGAREETQGRGFLGFQSRTVVDSRTDAPKMVTYYHTSFPYSGMVNQQDLYQHDGTTLISRTINTPGLKTLDATTNSQRYFSYAASSTTDSREVGGTKNGQLIATTATGFNYDDYGNATSIVAVVTDKDAGSPYLNQAWTTTISNSFLPDLSTWCVGLPWQILVTNSTNNGEPAVSRTTAYAIDYTRCRPTQQVVVPQTAYQVTTDYGYDDDAGNPQPDFGNLTSVAVTGSGMATRTTTIEWTAAARPTGQFPMKVTNAEGHVTQLDYDFNYGLVSSQTDPNNAPTYWQYDGFGRKKLETRPDNTSTLWLYSFYTPAPITEYVQVTEQLSDASGTEIRTNTNRFDTFERPTVQIQQLVAGNSSATIRAYNSRGQVQYDYFPYDTAGANNGYSTFTYDALNRVTQVQRPISANNSALQSTTYQYLGRTTVTTDAEGKQTTKIADINGWLRRSQDHNGYYQTFGYDAIGSLKSVTDSQSNTLFSATYDYGAQAFQTSTFDMDLGSWGYAPNALGEVVAYTDNKGISFYATFDKLSRPLTRTEPGNNTTWIWGTSAANHNIGQLQCVFLGTGSACSSSTYLEAYNYDGIGRLSQRDITADGTTYSYNSTYNSAGQLDTLTYPTSTSTSTSSYRLKLQYQYQSGLLRQVKDYNAATVFWQANAMSQRGQIAQEQLGNGLIVNKAYDAVTGMINSIQCGIGGGACSQNQSYLWDKVGNLIQRQNGNLGLTENFFYDNLHRLDYSQLNGVTNLDMTYDALGLGNIASRTDVANNAAWTYDPVHKHQVLQAGGGNTYSYDQNGNVTARNGNSITWTSYNYPSQITGPGETINLYYDVNRQRYKQLYTGNGLTETTLYIGGQMQKVSANGVDDYRYTITANGQTIAIMSRSTSGANATRYALNDYQGSVAKFTDSSGNSLVSESFTAFGARRNPLTWSGQATYGDQTTISDIAREGYTGHTALGSMNLNHMNGRVQDAITGRFLSADSYITEPGNTQNYNRYSYVLNNPMSFTDPSGFAQVCWKVTVRAPDQGLYGHVVDSNYDAINKDKNNLGDKLDPVTVTAPRDPQYITIKFCSDIHFEDFELNLANLEGLMDFDPNGKTNDGEKKEPQEKKGTSPTFKEQYEKCLNDNYGDSLSLAESNSLIPSADFWYAFGFGTGLFADALEGTQYVSNQQKYQAMARETYSPKAWATASRQLSLLKTLRGVSAASLALGVFSTSFEITAKANCGIRAY